MIRRFAVAVRLPLLLRETVFETVVGGDLAGEVDPAVAPRRCLALRISRLPLPG